MTAFSTAGFTCPALADNSKITCGAPLVTLNCLSVRALDGGLGAFMHRVERLEMDHLIALQGLIVFQAAQITARSMVSLFSARDASAALRMT